MLDPQNEEPEHYEVAKGEASESRAVGKGREAMPMIQKFKTYFESLMVDPRQTARFMTMSVGYLNLNPALMKCDQVSFMIALMQIAELGLMPGPTAGHAYLVPFGAKGRKYKTCTLIAGYKGLRHCAMRAISPGGNESAIEDIYASCIHKGDTWEEVRGTNRHLHHVPAREGTQEDSSITHAYSVARLRGSSNPVFVNLPRSRIDFFRSKSPAGKRGEGPWKDYYAAMAMKTAFKRLYPWLPSSYEADRLFEIEGRMERQAPQELEMDGKGFFEGSATDNKEESPEQPKPTKRMKAPGRPPAEKVTKMSDDPTEPQPQRPAPKPVPADEPEAVLEPGDEEDARNWLVLECKGLLQRAAKNGVNLGPFPPSDDLVELPYTKLKSLKSELKYELREQA